MKLRSYRPVAVVLVVLHLNACTSWQQISLQTGPVPEKVRVTTENDRFVLNTTRLVGDTAIAGMWSGRNASLRASSLIRDEGLRVIPLTDILLVERGRHSPARTAGLVVGILAGFYAFMAVALAVGDWEPR